MTYACEWNTFLQYVRRLSFFFFWYLNAISLLHFLLSVWCVRVCFTLCLSLPYMAEQTSAQFTFTNVRLYSYIRLRLPPATIDCRISLLCVFKIWIHDYCCTSWYSCNTFIALEPPKRATEKKNEKEAENKRYSQAQITFGFYCFSPIVYVAQERN